MGLFFIVAAGKNHNYIIFQFRHAGQEPLFYIPFGFSLCYGNACKRDVTFGCLVKILRFEVCYSKLSRFKQLAMSSTGQVGCVMHLGMFYISQLSVLPQFTGTKKWHLG